MPYLNDMGILCTLGCSAQEVRHSLVTRDVAVPAPESLMQECYGALSGVVDRELPPLPLALAAYECRNNRLAAAALEQMRPALDAAIARYSNSRIAVVMGTSTSGIVESEKAVRALAQGEDYPSQYHAVQGILGGLGDFVAQYLHVSGPVSTLSTACSSSANAVLSARRLLALGVCDAVVVGGVDSLCEMTVGGFGSLAASSSGLCKPFSKHRDGINIGEAAAVFLVTNEPDFMQEGAVPGTVQILGGAATSDAHHISAPHPEGEGAFAAMQRALVDAKLPSSRIDYLNVHGTGTLLNDAMESKAIHRLFGAQVPCSSTKSMTGHTLGASGAVELAFCWLLLTQPDNWRLPPSLYAKERDEGLAAIRHAGDNEYGEQAPRYCMSNSFAFGGSNVSLIIGAGDVQVL